ncbi:MAG: MFS transporter, partial [Atopobiaceae bacterium]
FGWIGDRHACPWFMSLGIFLAGSGMAGIGLFSDYRLVVCSAMVSGIGVAMFHPEGGRLANLAAGSRKAGGMSIFAVGGNIGFFVGPILAAAFISAFGLRGTLAFAVPASACALVLLGFGERFRRLGAGGAAAAEEGSSAQEEHWDRFGLLVAVLSARSAILYGLLAFIPLFIMNVLGQDAALSSLVISAASIVGALATLLSGRASGRFGTHRLAIFCLALMAVLIAVFAHVRILALAVVLAILLEAAADVFYPSAVALGMSYVPGHLGTASGLSYGVAVSVGGIAEPFLGMTGDSFGLPAVMMGLAGIAAAGTALAFILARVDAVDGRHMAR